MHITFIMPAIGKKKKMRAYIRSWQMEPLGIAILSALTPLQFKRTFFDDRLEKIDYTLQTDLVAISCETYTARRSYEIAKKFRDRGIKVVMGGFHPTLVPEEALGYVDSIVIGEAENVWPSLLDDLQNNNLQRKYQSEKKTILQGIFPDRSIFGEKKYLKIKLVETGRGCQHNCDFCTIHPFYKRNYTPRSLADVIQEVATLRRAGNHFYFFVDDNIIADTARAKELFRALIPYKINWFSQATINIAEDEELLQLMKKSGCMGILIGFESLDDSTLKSMNKEINLKYDRDQAIFKIHQFGIKIYATFVFGNDFDQENIFERTYQFAKKHKFFITAYNHLVPFPGSIFYQRLKKEERLINDQFWLDHKYTFGQICYHPKNFTAERLTNLCFMNRQRVYSISSLINRFFVRRNFANWYTPFLLIYSSLMAKRDVKKRQGLPMGNGDPIC